MVRFVLFAGTALLIPCALTAQSAVPAGRVVDVEARSVWWNGGARRIAPGMQDEERPGLLVESSSAGNGVVSTILRATPYPTMNWAMRFDVRGNGSDATFFERPFAGQVSPAPDSLGRHVLRAGTFDQAWPLLGMFEPTPTATRHLRRPLVLRFRSGHAVRDIRGERISRVVGDTTVDGRRYARVRDSATVNWSEDLPEWERTLDAEVVVERRVRGTILGWRIVDLASGQVLALTDSTRLEGTAVLRYPDGRRFVAPTHFVRVQHAEVVDSATFAARRDRARRNWTREHGTTVVPRPGLNTLLGRLWDREPGLRDSLWAELEATRRPAQRDSLIGLLMADQDRLFQYFLRIGDTTRALRPLPDAWREYRRHGVDTALWALLRRPMTDPGYAFRHDLSRDEYYEDAAQAFREWMAPPMLVEAESPCRPAVCEALEREWPGAREPRLRSLGLLVRLARDPVRWADTVLAWEHRMPLLRPAAAMIRRARLLPAPDEPWRGWLARDTVARWPPRVPSIQLTRETALLSFAGRLRHLDYSRSFRDGLVRAASDSERVVFRMLLEALHALTPDPDRLAAEIAGSVDLMRNRALAELELLSERDPADVADSALVLEVQRHVLDVLGGKRLPWPRWPGLTPTEPLALKPLNNPAILRYFRRPPALAVLDDEIRNIGFIPMPMTWYLSNAESGVMVECRVTLSGPFLRVHVQRVVLMRSPGGVGGGDETGDTIHLLRDRDGEWRIVLIVSEVT